MYGLQALQWWLPSINIQGTAMQSKIKDVLMTTAAVLATVYVLNQIAFTRNLVQKALAG